MRLFIGVEMMVKYFYVHHLPPWGKYIYWKGLNIGFVNIYVDTVLYTLSAKCSACKPICLNI